jgi:hypothetical protein
MVLLRRRHTAWIMHQVSLGARKGSDDDNHSKGRQNGQHDVSEPLRSLSMGVDVVVGHGRYYCSVPDRAAFFRFVWRTRSRWTENESTNEALRKITRPVT